MKETTMGHPGRMGECTHGMREKNGVCGCVWSFPLYKHTWSIGRIHMISFPRQGHGSNYRFSVHAFISLSVSMFPYRSIACGYLRRLKDSWVLCGRLHRLHCAYLCGYVCEHTHSLINLLIKQSVALPHGWLIRNIVNFGHLYPSLS